MDTNQTYKSEKEIREDFEKSHREALASIIMLGTFIGALMGLFVFFYLYFDSIDLAFRIFIETNFGQTEMNFLFWLVGIINIGIIGSILAATLGALLGILPAICLGIFFNYYVFMWAHCSNLQTVRK